MRATDTPAVFVTHDQTEALAVGDRVAVMRAGRIEHVDGPHAVFHHPVNRFVAAFMGEAAFLPIDRSGDRWTSVLGSVEVVGSVERPVALVRPDDLRFVPRGDGGAGEDEDEIVAAEFRGADWRYRVRLADGTEVPAAGSHLTPWKVGDRGRIEMVPGHRLIAVADEE